MLKLIKSAKTVAIIFVAFAVLVLLRSVSDRNSLGTYFSSLPSFCL
jgi:hypothetical protein